MLGKVAEHVRRQRREGVVVKIEALQVRKACKIAHLKGRQPLTR